MALVYIWDIDSLDVMSVIGWYAMLELKLASMVLLFCWDLKPCGIKPASLDHHVCTQPHACSWNAKVLWLIDIYTSSHYRSACTYLDRGAAYIDKMFCEACKNVHESPGAGLKKFGWIEICMVFFLQSKKTGYSHVHPVAIWAHKWRLLLLVRLDLSLSHLRVVYSVSYLQQFLDFMAMSFAGGNQTQRKLGGCWRTSQMSLAAKWNII